LRAFIGIRHRIIGLESPEFDNAMTQGMRFFVGCVNYATSENAPAELKSVDSSRGVMSICGVPFKVYRPNDEGKPRQNKTAVANQERTAITDQLSLFAVPFGNILLRVDVDEIGEPVAILWEEWTNGTRVWHARVYDNESENTLSVINPSALPEPAQPRKPSIGVDEDVVINDSDDDSED